MANDAPDKTNSGNSENNSSSNSDQQKVPPLRIVLNSAGNQKSSTISTAASNSTQIGLKRDKSHDIKSEGTLKTGGKVRIKLSTGKQQTSRGGSGSYASGSNTQANNKSSNDSGTKGAKQTSFGDKQPETKEESSTTSFGHLRRITRRSQRAVQVVSNEDEESVSSMTSLDENQANNNIVNSDSNINNETEQANSSLETPGTGNSTSATASSSNAANGSTSAETPRRYKRRKCEISESLSLDSDSLFGLQNYKLPVQNSFELFKNIRKQVDKRLTSLSSVHPKKPHGFKDYMLTRGTYLLDGNKLGNGTNLFLGEDGGLHSVPIGKFHAIRNNRVSYSVCSRAKVPLGLAVNSPLYDLFLEQEKERYRMRMQHIKERERLTLSVEQEIMRVYNQAALAAINQIEPFSACTMLKHQETYNYLDSDGIAILSREDARQEQAAKPDDVRTRRRQHSRTSPPPPTGRRNSNNENSQNATDTVSRDSKKNDNPETSSISRKDEPPQSVSNDDTEARTSASSDPIDVEACRKGNQLGAKDKKKHSNRQTKGTESIMHDPSRERPKSELTEDVVVKVEGEGQIVSSPSSKSDEQTDENTSTRANDQGTKSDTDVKESTQTGSQAEGASDRVDKSLKQDIRNSSRSPNDCKIQTESTSTTDHPAERVRVESGSPKNLEEPFSEEDRQAYNKEVFLSQLQEIDDKWDRIRNELLIRHRNETESLHAIQKLEWEWKTKEIGACDVRMTPVIDSTLVPKVNIYQQDY